MAGIFGSLVEALPSLITSGGELAGGIIQARAAKKAAKKAAKARVRTQVQTGLVAPSQEGLRRLGELAGGERAFGSPPRASTNGATGTWNGVGAVPDWLRYLGGRAARGFGHALYEKLTSRFEHPRGGLLKARTPAPRLSDGTPFAPPGFRLHYDDEMGDHFITRIRHMNPLNLSALKRAERRTDRFGKIVRKYFRFQSRAVIAPVGTVVRRKRPKKK